MTEKKKSSSTPSKMSQMLSQARESLKLLETLEKETIAKARTFVRKPLGANRKRLTNEKILTSLRSLGVATRSEVEALERRVDALQNEIVALNTALAQAGTKRGKLPQRPAPSAESFPNT